MIWRQLCRRMCSVAAVLQSPSLAVHAPPHTYTRTHAGAESVLEAFVRLHDKGLVYRGSYMVNWSPGLQTGAACGEAGQGGWGEARCQSGDHCSAC